MEAGFLGRCDVEMERCPGGLYINFRVVFRQVAFRATCEVTAMTVGAPSLFRSRWLSKRKLEDQEDIRTTAVARVP